MTAASSRLRAGTLHLVWATLALVGCATDQSVMARSYDDEDTSYGGPARVGRLSYVAGRVDAYTDEQSAWAPARLNLPVTSNTGIWTDHDAKAEVTIGSTSIHIDDDSEVDFDELDDDGIDIDLEDGTLAQRVRQLPRDERWTVRAGDTRIQWLTPGSYSVSYRERSHTVSLKVFDGSARVDSRRGSYTVYAGQQLTLDEDEGGGQIGNRLSGSRFDDWAEQRNRAFDRSQASRYVSPEMTGAEQLDGYGTWSSDAQYGTIWYPTQVVVGWAPYRYGHWAWLSPWGWTWVDDSPWGFAPFHYGRWVQVHGRWGWCPGPRHHRPVFAPALVRVDRNDGHRPTHWVPLAPKESYHRDHFKPQPWQGGNRPSTDNRQQSRPIAHPGAPRTEDRPRKDDRRDNRPDDRQGDRRDEQRPPQPQQQQQQQQPQPVQTAPLRPTPPSRNERPVAEQPAQQQPHQPRNNPWPGNATPSSPIWGPKFKQDTQQAAPPSQAPVPVQQQPQPSQRGSGLNTNQDKGRDKPNPPWQRDQRRNQGDDQNNN